MYLDSSTKRGRDMLKKYFLVDNKIFDIKASPHTLVLYAVLCKFANKNGECFPSRKKICKVSQITNSTNRKNMMELENNDIISKSKRFAPCGRQTSNLYRIKRSKKNCFKVPGDIFGCGLSIYSICVYLYLCKCSDDELKCFPSQSQIAANCNMSRQKVNACIKELRNKRMIRTFRQVRMYDNGNSVLIYDLNVKRPKYKKRRAKRIIYLFRIDKLLKYLSYISKNNIDLRQKFKIKADYGQALFDFCESG